MILKTVLTLHGCFPPFISEDNMNTDLHLVPLIPGRHILPLGFLEQLIIVRCFIILSAVTEDNKPQEAMQIFWFMANG